MLYPIALVVPCLASSAWSDNKTTNPNSHPYYSYYVVVHHDDNIMSPQARNHSGKQTITRMQEP